MGLLRSVLQQLTLKPFRMQLLNELQENKNAIHGLRNQLFAASPVAIIRNTKMYLPLFYVDHIQSAIYQTNDFYELTTLDFLKLHYKSFSFIVDAGSNIGNHALYFASQLRAERIECFEPNKITFENLKRNVEINSLEKIISVHNSGLGARTSFGIEKGYSVFNTGLNSVEEVNGPENKDSISLLRLDELGYKNIDFIKIDVEGHELSVLTGAEETIRLCKPVILVEAFDDSISQIENLLTGYGYKMFFRPEKHNFIFEPHK
jgi:FkbM family methyltransferase